MFSNRPRCCRQPAFWLLLCGLAVPAPAQTNDFSGTTDDSIRTVLAAVANHQLHSLSDGNYATVYTLSGATNATKPTGIEWDYPWGVNLYGLLQVKQATGDTNAENFVLNHDLIVGRYYAWLNSLKTSVTNATPAQLAGFFNRTALSQFMAINSLDYCGSMTATLLEGALQHAAGPTTEQVQAGLTTAAWVSTSQSRLPDGTLSRGNTLWADDLYMSCPFLIRWYQYTGNTNYLNDAARQIVNMAGYLQDTNGIWFHGYYTNTHTVNGIKWGRANGWAMVATTEVLGSLPLNHPARSNVLDVLRRHFEGIKSVQAPSGMWRQVLDDTNAWEETSCSAMFTYCLARAANRGWIDRTNLDVARKGFAAVCRNIQTNGVILGTCQGTSLSTSESYYLGLSQPVDDMHGRGVTMLAGAEILLRPKLFITPAGGTTVVSWNAGVPNATLETSPDLAAWTPFTGSTTISNWQNIAIASVGDSQFFRLNLSPPVYPPVPLTYEAETLVSATNGAVAAQSADTNASGGLVMTLNADGVGDYLEYTLPGVPAGRYELRFGFKSGNDRAQVNLVLDGNSLGGALDQFWPVASYPLVDFGRVTFVVTGDHMVRLTVGGRGGASKGYTISADCFVLVPQ